MYYYSEYYHNNYLLAWSRTALHLLLLSAPILLREAACSTTHRSATLHSRRRLRILLLWSRTRPSDRAPSARSCSVCFNNLVTLALIRVAWSLMLMAFKMSLISYFIILSMPIFYIYIFMNVQVLE